MSCALYSPSYIASTLKISENNTTKHEILRAEPKKKKKKKGATRGRDEVNQVFKLVFLDILC